MIYRLFRAGCTVLKSWEKELAWLAYLVLFGFDLGWPTWPLVDLFGPWLTCLVLVWPIWSLVGLSGLWLTCLALGPWLAYLALGWSIWPLVDLFGPCLAYLVLGWPIWPLVDLSSSWSLVNLFGPWLIYLVLEWLSGPWIRFCADCSVSCFASALVSSQGLSFYSDEDLISIWTLAVIIMPVKLPEQNTSIANLTRYNQALHYG